MSAVEKGCQLALAGAGFLVGYAWVVLRWADRAGIPKGGLLAASLLSTACLLACGYVLLLALLFWPLIPSARGGGLRIVVAPTAFTLSALLGALGMDWALRFVG